MASFKRLARFIPRSNPDQILIGEPVEEDLDIGLALYHGQAVKVDVYSGISILNAGVKTGKIEVIERVLSPLSRKEVGTIRCIGLNYKQHAEEVGLSLPTVPTLFMKPETSLADPWPSPSPLPKITQQDGSGDYESELVFIIGKEGKDIPESEAMKYVLGYTAANDVSSRTSQFAQSQWCFSKGFDGACPIGPVVVSQSLIPDPSALKIRGLKNGAVMQDCGIDDLIFSIPKLISFLSQGTTLLPGTLVLTGTPAGVGVSKKPQEKLRAVDEFRVEITPYIGSLISKFVYD